jgi:tetratricopeptide (TPR) repeat protein
MSSEAGARKKAGGDDDLRKASQAYEAGDYARALALYDSTLARGEPDAIVLNNKGAALDALGRHGEAEECYREALRTSVRYELAWHNLANCLLSQRRFTEAAKAYTRAASLNPERTENFVSLAEALIESGRRRRARAVTESLAIVSSRHPSVFHMRADLYVALGEGDEAVKCCHSYIAERRSDVQGYVKLGNVQHELGHFAEAAVAFERALEFSPEDAEIWNNLGYSQFCAGATDRALESYDRALSLDPRYKLAWYNKGYALHGIDQLEEAVECYEAAVAVDTDDKVLLNNWGNALYNLGRYAESIPRFVRAIRVDPDYEIAWNNIGNALEKLGMYREAIPFHDRSLEIRADFDYALYAKGICLGEIGAVEEGFELIQQSLELNPSYEEAWRARSRLASRLGRADDALMSILECLEINPRFHEAWADLGELLVSVGDGAEGEAAFETALKLLEADHPYSMEKERQMEERVDLLVRMGRYRSALAILESAARFDIAGASWLLRLVDLRRILSLYDLPFEIRDTLARSHDPRVLSAYAELLLESGDSAAAFRLLERVDTDSLDAALTAVKARVLESIGDLEGARTVLERAGFRLSPEDRYAIRGELLEAQGDYAGATASYSRAMASGSRGELALAVARSLERMGGHKAAKGAAEIAIGLDPCDWEAFEVKAMACRGLGNEKRAAAAEETARSLMRRFGAGSAGVEGVNDG